MLGRKAQKEDEGKRRSVTPLKLKNGSAKEGGMAKYYVPIAVCIETSFEFFEEMENLLVSLIKPLRNREIMYQLRKNNRVYKFAEFAYYIALLTHLNRPPPFSKLTIDFHGSSVVLHEDELNDFPVLDEPSVVQLYSYLGLDNILDLWTTFLTEEPTIVHTDDPEVIFYIVKGIEQLIFPLTWTFSKGITCNVDSLRCPQPFFYAMMKDRVEEESVHRVMGEQSRSYCFLEIEANRAPRLRVFNRETPIVYPRIQKLKNNLTKVLNKYSVNVSGKIYQVLPRERDFSNEFRRAFFDEVMDLVSGIEIFARNSRPDELGSRFLTKYRNSHHEMSPSEEEFVQRFSESQPLTYIYDELVHGFQGNYSRILAMKRSKKENSGKSCDRALFEVTVNESEVQGFLGKVSEAAEVRRVESEAANKLDWVKGVNSVRSAYMKRMKVGLYSPMARPSNPPKSKRNKESNGLRLDCSPVKDKEIKSYMWKPKHIAEQENTKPTFYGPKGLCSFLEDLLPNSYADIFGQYFAEKLESFFNDALKDKACSPQKLFRGEAECMSLLPPFEFTDMTADETFTSKLLNPGSESGSPVISSCPFFAGCFNTPQFFLYIASYFTLYDKNPYEILKAYMRAFELLNESSFYSIFPTQKFKRLLEQLDFSTIRKLLKSPSHLSREIKDIYEKKKPAAKVDSSNVVKRTLRKYSGKPLKEEFKSDSRNLLSTAARARHLSLFAAQESARRYPKTIGARNCNEEVKFVPDEQKLLGDKQYINRHKEKADFVNRDPTVVISSLLHDLILLLRETQKTGTAMFKKAAEKRSFEEIERQAAALRVLRCITVAQELLHKARRTWLRVDELAQERTAEDRLLPQSPQLPRALRHVQAAE
eukprot:TRINITY_DN4295_c0_g1_i27.p1 TRINITY_DN4295_c0_g1~~TRINITY_DN4295_c0_g1_i27.p1  ORF type:complete len:874 (-),score=224.88 TRINITY_DN4295_c0_g1_i27:422-3043(-)